MGRWGDREIGEIFIKRNYPDMILVLIAYSLINKIQVSRFKFQLTIAFLILMR
ncbi:MAG: hypothetical protein F6J94_03805 [Moorea sp. SIO1F2]|nr:hypothetical protein [Moorena sp. SIO1F2]